MKLLYEGSVKNIFLSDQDPSSLIFDYTDDYSVFDWGKMPDAIPGKGQSLAALSALLFERLENSEEWKTFFERFPRTQLNTFSPALKQVAEKLQTQGLKTHYRFKKGETQICVDRVHVTPPVTEQMWDGSVLSDYRTFSIDRAGELIPLEVVFRHELVTSSSALGRYPDRGFIAGQVFETPLLECFTKLEKTDRFLNPNEALSVARLSPARFEEVLLHTFWVSLILKDWFQDRQIKLIDGKLEWALSREGHLMLVDAIGPDELRLDFQGRPLSKEVLRSFYRETPWYLETVQAKKEAALQGTADWQKFVKSVPSKLPPELLQSVSLMYRELTRMMS